MNFVAWSLGNNTGKDSVFRPRVRGDLSNSAAFDRFGSEEAKQVIRGTIASEQKSLGATPSLLQLATFTPGQTRKTMSVNSDVDEIFGPHLLQGGGGMGSYLSLDPKGTVNSSGSAMRPGLVDFSFIGDQAGRSLDGVVQKAPFALLLRELLVGDVRITHKLTHTTFVTDDIPALLGPNAPNHDVNVHVQHISSPWVKRGDARYGRVPVSHPSLLVHNEVSMFRFMKDIGTYGVIGFEDLMLSYSLMNHVITDVGGSPISYEGIDLYVGTNPQWIDGPDQVGDGHVSIARNSAIGMKLSPMDIFYRINGFARKSRSAAPTQTANPWGSGISSNVPYTQWKNTGLVWQCTPLNVRQVETYLEVRTMNYGTLIFAAPQHLPGIRLIHGNYEAVHDGASFDDYMKTLPFAVFNYVKGSSCANLIFEKWHGTGNVEYDPLLTQYGENIDANEQVGLLLGLQANQYSSFWNIANSLSNGSYAKQVTGKAANGSLPAVSSALTPNVRDSWMAQNLRPGPDVNTRWCSDTMTLVDQFFAGRGGVYNNVDTQNDPGIAYYLDKGKLGNMSRWVGLDLLEGDDVYGSPRSAKARHLDILAAHGGYNFQVGSLSDWCSRSDSFQSKRADPANAALSAPSILRPTKTLTDDLSFLTRALDTYIYKEDQEGVLRVSSSQPPNMRAFAGGGIGAGMVGSSQKKKKKRKFYPNMGGQL